MRAAPVLAALAVVAASASARAEVVNCPAGSTQKTEGDLTWCEPTVCETDANCRTGEVCKEVALCVEIGNMPGDGGKRIMVRQRCGADKACPQTTTCSDLRRCLSRAEADKMAPPPAASAEAGAPPKKSCGCHVPGAPGSGAFGGVLAAIGIAIAGARRRRA